MKGNVLKKWICLGLLTGSLCLSVGLAGCDMSAVLGTPDGGSSINSGNSGSGSSDGGSSDSGSSDSGSSDSGSSDSGSSDSGSSGGNENQGGGNQNPDEGGGNGDEIEWTVTGISYTVSSVTLPLNSTETDLRARLDQDILQVDCVSADGKLTKIEYYTVKELTLDLSGVDYQTPGSYTIYLKYEKFPTPAEVTVIIENAGSGDEKPGEGGEIGGGDDIGGEGGEIGGGDDIGGETVWIVEKIEMMETFQFDTTQTIEDVISQICSRYMHVYYISEDKQQQKDEDLPIESSYLDVSAVDMTMGGAYSVWLSYEGQTVEIPVTVIYNGMNPDIGGVTEWNVVGLEYQGTEIRLNEKETEIELLAKLDEYPVIVHYVSSDGMFNDSKTFSIHDVLVDYASVWFGVVGTYSVYINYNDYWDPAEVTVIIESDGSDIGGEGGEGTGGEGGDVGDEEVEWMVETIDVNGIGMLYFNSMQTTEEIISQICSYQMYVHFISIDKMNEKWEYVPIEAEYLDTSMLDMNMSGEQGVRLIYQDKETYIPVMIEYNGMNPDIDMSYVPTAIEWVGGSMYASTTDSEQTIRKKYANENIMVHETNMSGDTRPNYVSFDVVNADFSALTVSDGSIKEEYFAEGEYTIILEYQGFTTNVTLILMRPDNILTGVQWEQAFSLEALFNYDLSISPDASRTTYHVDGTGVRKESRIDESWLNNNYISIVSGRTFLFETVGLQLSEMYQDFVFVASEDGMMGYYEAKGVAYADGVADVTVYFMPFDMDKINVSSISIKQGEQTYSYSLGNYGMVHILHWIEKDKTQSEWQNALSLNALKNVSVYKHYRTMGPVNVITGGMTVENGVITQWKEEDEVLTFTSSTLTNFLNDWVYSVACDYENFYLTNTNEEYGLSGGYYEVADKYIICGNKTCQLFQVTFDEQGRLSQIFAYGFLDGNVNKNFDVQYMFTYPETDM